MSALPIRLRLTIAFALAMTAVLAGAAYFVYLRLDADLTESIDDALETRAESLVFALGGPADEPTVAPREDEADEGFVQVVEGRRVIDSSGAVGRRAVLTAAEVERTPEDELVIERNVAGIEGASRVLAVPIPGQGPRVLVVGQSTEDRAEALSNLVASFAIGGPVAVLIASLFGYSLAAAGMRPVEAMRERARRVSFEQGTEPLPLPAARDEIRRLGETLNEMLARLGASFERERRFVADASHELRSPIAVIKAELDNALRTSGDDAGLREALRSASEECDRLAQLADDLLVLARSGEGKLPVHREAVEARAALEEARTRFAGRAAERGREIVVEVEGEPRTCADSLRLRQALSNLIDNALRYGEGDVSLRGLGAGEWVEIEVGDEGAGFPPELIPRAFERFSRGDEARGRGGAGLGLAIVRAIADAHGGRVEVVPGPGATVRLRLPAAAGSQGHLRRDS